MSAALGRHPASRHETMQVSAHFVGSIVYVEKGLYQVSSQSPLLVIDGQQRLTTVTSADRGSGPQALAMTRTARRVLGEEAPQLLPAQPPGRWRATLQADAVPDRQDIPDRTAGPAAQPKEHSLRVEANFDFFKQRVAEAQGRSGRPLQRAGEAGHRRHFAQPRPGQPAAHLREPELHRPGTQPGRPHSQLHSDGAGAPASDHSSTREYWRPMEVDFGQEAYRDPLRQLHAPLPDGEDRRDSERP